MENEILAPILLRSSTPGPSEKVLKYLEGLQDPVPEDGVEDEYRQRWSMNKSPFPSGAAPHQGGQYSNRAGSAVSYGLDQKPVKDDEVASNEQDGLRSELGSLPKREPGPEDPPGPRYESFDSGPSFGNKGPLPDVDLHFGRPFGTWQPNWGPAIPNQQTGSGPKTPVQQPTAWPPTSAVKSQAGTTPGFLNKPLPDARASPSVGINIISPSTPPRSQAQPRSPSPSKRTVTDSRSHGVQTPPHSPPRQGNRTPLAQPSERAMSPIRSQHSPGAGRVRSPEYPPLPASMYDGSYRDDHPASPISQTARLERAPSVSPSDSQSQVHLKRAAAKSPPPKEVSVNAELSPRASSKHMANEPANGADRAKSPTLPMSHNSHQHRPFSPYRHASTQEDLLHAALRGAAAQHQNVPPAASRTEGAEGRPGSGSVTSNREQALREAEAARRLPRPMSPDVELNAEEQRIVNEALRDTPRTSYAPSALESDVVHSHFHDMELCVLLHEAEDPNAHEVVKKAVRKAVRQRVKRLGMKYDNESLKQYKRTFHNHDPNVHLQPDYTPHASEEAPEWAKELMNTMSQMQQRLDGLAPKIERLPSRSNFQSAGDTRYRQEYEPEEGDDYDGRSPMTQTVNIATQPTGTGAESLFQPETALLDDPEALDYDIEHRLPTTIDGETRTRPQSDYLNDGRDDSPGQQYLEEELYKLRVKPAGSQSGLTHHTWEVARDDSGEHDDDEEGEDVPESGLQEIPDTNTRAASPPLPPIPHGAQEDLATTEDRHQAWSANELTPWQRIHQRLLSWAIIWPMSELDQALNSTTRGHQIDEVALSIWCTQCYKRYVRTQLTENPPRRVDRLVVPPNMADAISTATYNGRHGDASAMLRDLWAPFGLEGMPRLLVVLMKHRGEENHWVVHRYSLPDGALTTYDSYPEKTLADGRPLGWWFAIRVAWPNPSYPSPDHLMQKIVRMHRPMQLGIDNSVAAAGIWRNVLMSTRAERSVDLERLRDLVNQEVKNLRQRKQMGKLSINGPRPNWDDFH